MKTVFLIFLSCAGFAALSFGQQDTLHRLDQDGKKDGDWIEYIDAIWKPVKDSSHAAYCRYSYYDHGYAVQGKTRSCKLNHTLVYTGAGDHPNNTLKLLDGEYTWLDKKGRVVSITVYKKGHIVSDKYFAWHLFNCDFLGYNRRLTGKLHESSDFTKHYNSQAHSWYMELYDTYGNVQRYFIRKTEKYGWVGVFENS